MKNQYVGDINDYRKYGLIRLLSDGGALRTAVCWMLTAGDGRADGEKTAYLRQPGEYRVYDPELFDRLEDLVLQRDARDVQAVEQAGILPAARFHSALLTDDPEQRRRYMDDFLALAKGCDLVFFDPDNGIEVKSVPLGRKDSAKYLHWSELKRVFAAGASVLIYQHFPREEFTCTRTLASDSRRRRRGWGRVLRTPQASGAGRPGCRRQSTGHPPQPEGA